MRTKKGTEKADNSDQKQRIAYVQGQFKCTQSLRRENKRKTRRKQNKIKE